MAKTLKEIRLNMKKKGLHKIKSDNCSSKCGLKAQDRSKKQGGYIKQFGYLRRLPKLNSMTDIESPVCIDILALKTANPPNKPFLHLTLAGIENLYPRRFRK